MKKQIQKAGQSCFYRDIRIVLLSSFLLIYSISFWGCAAKTTATGLPKIAAKELIDSLVAQDTLLKTVRITGKGNFRGQGKDESFLVGLHTSRPDKMLSHIKGPLGITAAVLWLCGKDSLCIYLPAKNAVLVEPLGINDPNIVLPPATPILVDMFSGMAPVYRFADSLQNFEEVAGGYYLTFRKNDEILVALAKPYPWHVENFQWTRTTNQKEQVDVQFSDGEVQNGIWRPDKITITAPALDQIITLDINKCEMNIAIDDSLFKPNLPEQVKWMSAF